MPILKSYLRPEKNPKKIRFVTYPSFFNQVIYLIFLKIFSFFRKWSNVCHYGFFDVMYDIFFIFSKFFRKWSYVNTFQVIMAHVILKNRFWIRFFTQFFFFENDLYILVFTKNPKFIFMYQIFLNFFLGYHHFFFEYKYKLLMYELLENIFYCIIKKMQ